MTGVQTCALPIWRDCRRARARGRYARARRSTLAGRPRAAPERPAHRPPRVPQTGLAPAARLRPATRREGRCVADVRVSEPESRFAVVVLLRHHAVEADGAGPGMRDGRIPNAQAVAAAAQIAAHDVEAEERESVIVIEAGDGR